MIKSTIIILVSTIVAIGVAIITSILMTPLKQKEVTMYEIEIYSRKWKDLFRGRRQWYWRMKYKDKIIATGGEGYYNRGDLEAVLKNIARNFPLAVEELD